MKQSDSSKFLANYSPKRVRHQLHSVSFKHLSKSSINTESTAKSKPSKILEICERNNRPNPHKVSPNLAQIVIKKYIVQIFKDEKQQKLSRSRSTAFGFKKIPQKQTLKLSDQIKKILDSTALELKKLQEDFGTVEKKNESLRILLEKKKSEKFAHLTNALFVKYNYKEEIKYKKKEEMTGSFAIRERLDLQSSFLKNWSKTEEVMAELYEKTMVNRGLKESSKQFHHLNLTLIMNSAIIGERLKGLYLAYNEISAAISLERKLFLLVSTFNRNCKVLIEKDTENTEIADIVLPDILVLIKSSHLSFYTRNNMINELKRLKNVIISKVTNCAQDITSNRQESENLLSLHSSVESKLQLFNEEYERAHVKLAEILATNKKNQMNAERVCENCSKVYSEENNFNWSCKTHSNIWGGSIYWCCGSTEKDSQGCQKSKHLTKEESEEKFEERRIEEKACKICKKVGHLEAECELDPNSIVKRTKSEGVKRGNSQISLEKISDVYGKQNKDFKLTRSFGKINQLKASLTQSFKKKPYKREKAKKKPSFVPGKLNPLVQTMLNSNISEAFPQFSTRKSSLTPSTRSK